ncbi:Zinc finger protein 252 [Harpegnathos saltator]|uniref:Zinc finger protein 252 n=1 Tax=Harpegnathos saltator TaxID=610380 RepID=E2BSY3_HARSA|nr:Zinc finger protein 252 [Harpegnathos saltator]
MRCTSMRQSRNKSTSHIAAQREDHGARKVAKKWNRQRDFSDYFGPSLMGNTLNGVFTVNIAVAKDVNMYHECEICDQSFNTLEDVERHMKERHEFIVCICDLCGYMDLKYKVQKHIIKKHKDTYFGGQSYDENEEGKNEVEGTWSLEQLISYSRSDLGPIINEVDNSYKRPMKSLQKNKNRKDLFFCPFCNKNVHDTMLMGHLSVHVGGRSYVCSVCSKKFNLKHQMEQHMLIHMGKKLYICNVYDVAIAQELFFNRHRDRH